MDTASIRRLIEHLGAIPDPDTPARYLKALEELTQGYRMDAKAILSKQYEEPGNQLITFNGIRFASLCKHHLLPFTGTVQIAYRPNGIIVGLSKMARLVDCFSKRLTLQERLTNEIADAIEDNLKPIGVSVKVVAKHGCIECRGVRQALKIITLAHRGQPCLD